MLAGGSSAESKAEMVATVFTTVEKKETILITHQEALNSLSTLRKSWPKLFNALHLRIIDDESFPNLMACFEKCGFNSLQDISFRSGDQQIHSLDGMGPTLKTFRLSLNNVTGNVMEIIVSGLCQNEIIADTLENHGSDCLAEYLSATSTLESVGLAIAEEHSSYFQNVVLQALSSNPSIRELNFRGGFHDPSCDNQVEMLLATNKHIEILNVEINRARDTWFDYAWFQTMANGLRCNSTLKAFRVEVCYENDVDYGSFGPLFDSQTSPVTNLRTLVIDSETMNLDDGRCFADMVQNPNCTLRKVDIQGLQDLDLLPAFLTEEAALIEVHGNQFRQRFRA